MQVDFQKLVVLLIQINRTLTERDNEMKKINKHHVALVFSVTALAVACVNLFLLNNYLRALTWSLLLISIVLNIWGLFRRCDELSDENILLLYEISELQYSYKQMGKYVESLGHDDLYDIDLGIKNELNDIEVRKKWFAENHGFKVKKK